MEIQEIRHNSPTKRGKYCCGILRAPNVQQTLSEPRGVFSWNNYSFRPFAWDIIFRQPRGVLPVSPGRGQRPAREEAEGPPARTSEKSEEIKGGGGEERGVISASLGWDSALTPRM